MHCKKELGIFVVIGSLAAVVLADCDPSQGEYFTPEANPPSGHTGFSVAISESTVLIGAPDLQEGAGRIFILQLDGSGLGSVQQIGQPSPGPGHFFGYSVDLRGDVLIVGVPGTSTTVMPPYGAAYIYRFDGSSWQYEGSVRPSDGALYDAFGTSVSISGTTAVVGSVRDDDNGTNSGSVYVYEFDGVFWNERVKLLASDGEPYAAFGTSISLDAETLAIGAPEDNQNGTASGSVYVFTREAGVWSEQQKILPAGGQNGDYFGASVSLSCSRLIAGADWDDDRGSNSGAAYIFQTDGTNWIQQAKLTASDGVASEQFGHAVAIDGPTAIVGANEANTTLSETGAAYVFQFDGAGWTESAKLISDDPETQMYFANAVAIHGDRAVVGAWKENGFSVESGAAYVFELGCACAVDLNGDGVLDIFDVFAFLDAFNASDTVADFTGDGTLDIFDVFAFLGAFNAGCP